MLQNALQVVTCSARLKTIACCKSNIKGKMDKDLNKIFSFRQKRSIFNAASFSYFLPLRIRGDFSIATSTCLDLEKRHGLALLLRFDRQLFVTLCQHCNLSFFPETFHCKRKILQCDFSDNECSCTFTFTHIMFF